VYQQGTRIYDQEACTMVRIPFQRPVTHICHSGNLPHSRSSTRQRASRRTQRAAPGNWRQHISSREWAMRRHHRRKSYHTIEVSPSNGGQSPAQTLMTHSTRRQHLTFRTISRPRGRNEVVCSSLLDYCLQGSVRQGWAGRQAAHDNDLNFWKSTTPPAHCHLTPL
jgi:hypothetical protein